MRVDRDVTESGRFFPASGDQRRPVDRRAICIPVLGSDAIVAAVGPCCGHQPAGHL
jgi:hypothetical protein